MYSSSAGAQGEDVCNAGDAHGDAGGLSGHAAALAAVATAPPTPQSAARAAATSGSPAPHDPAPTLAADSTGGTGDTRACGQLAAVVTVRTGGQCVRTVSANGIVGGRCAVQHRHTETEGGVRWI